MCAIAGIICDTFYSESDLSPALLSSYGNMAMVTRFQGQLCGCTYYSGAIMSLMASQITGVSIVCLTICQAQIKENIKAPRH